MVKKLKKDDVDSVLDWTLRLPDTVEVTFGDTEYRLSIGAARKLHLSLGADLWELSQCEPD